MNDDWQPIETAKCVHGEVILGWMPDRADDPDEVYVLEWRDAAKGWVEAGGERYEIYEPKMWKPRPNPPKSTNVL